MRCRESAQACQIAAAERLHVAQHHGGDGIAAGQLDLRQGFPGIHAGNQLAQRHQHVADVPWHHMALRHVGHITALALMKTHQHRMLLAHIAHRQARPVAISPGGPLDGPEQVVGLDLADVPEVVFQHPLLDSHLRTHMEVLHLAAAARAGMQAEVRASRAHALRGLAMNSHHHRFFKAALLAVHIGGHPFKRQRTLNEHNLAVCPVGNALRFHVQGLYREDVRQVLRGLDGFIIQFFIGHA